MAVSEAIEDMEAGDIGRAVRAVAAEIRTKHGWSGGWSAKNALTPSALQ